jgi:hypothetical protein
VSDVRENRERYHPGGCKWPCPDPVCPEGNQVSGEYLDSPQFGPLGGSIIRKCRIIETSDDRWWFAWREVK